MNRWTTSIAIGVVLYALGGVFAWVGDKVTIAPRLTTVLLTPLSVINESFAMPLPAWTDPIVFAANFVFWPPVCLVVLLAVERIAFPAKLSQPIGWKTMIAVVTLAATIAVVSVVLSFRDVVRFSNFLKIPDRATRQEVRAILGRADSDTNSKAYYSGPRGSIDIEYDEVGRVSKKLFTMRP